MSPHEAVLMINGPPPSGFDEISILIVDDEPGNRETLADIFSEMDYHADSAGTGHLALEMIRRQFYNVAILDIRLPDMLGTELLASLKEISPVTTCIMVTGYASLQTSMAAIKLGAYDYLIKPLDIDRVSIVIQNALEQQRLQFGNQRLLERFRSLSEVTDTGLATLNLDELLEALLRSFIQAMKADAGAILLVDESGRRLEVRAAQGVEEAEGFAVPLGEGFAGRIADQQGPLLVTDVLGDERVTNPVIYASGIRSMLGVPLRAKERLIGVVHVDCFAPDAFVPEQVDLFDVLATRAALLIDNARLYEQEQRLRGEAEELAAREHSSKEELRTLYAVAQDLVESMGLEERLQKLAENLLPVMGARRCVIWLMEESALVPKTVAGVDEVEREIWLQERIEPGEFGPALRSAVDSGEPQVVVDASRGGLVGGDLPRRHDFRSVLVLPMVLSRRLIGLAWLDQPGETRLFTPDQQRLGQLIARQAAIAIENAQAFEQERTVASTLQQSFLPRFTVKVPGFDVGHLYHPAYTVAQVGGDYYDFIELADEKLGVVMGDVCGKGLTAAIFTAMAKYMLRAYAMEDPAPASVIRRLNRALYSQMSEDCMFITLVYGVLDLRTGEFTYVNAAHPHPLIYHPARNDVTELTTTGGMVGALPTMEFHEGRSRLEPGAVLLLYTDGVTEARTGNEMLEIQGVQAVLRRAAGASAQTICELVYRRAEEFSDGSLKDDVAIVAIRAESSTRSASA